MRFGIRTIPPVLVAHAVAAVFFTNVRYLPSIAAISAEMLLVLGLFQIMRLSVEASLTLRVVRSLFLIGICSLSRAFFLLLATGFETEVVQHCFYVMTMSEWLATVTVMPIVFLLTIPRTWTGWTSQRLGQVFALSLGSGIAQFLMVLQEVQNDTAFLMPLVLIAFLLLTGLIVRFEFLGMSIFQMLAVVAFGVYCMTQMHDSPRLIFAAGALGASFGLLWLITSSWVERRQETEARDTLLLEVERQRDELKRLSDQAQEREAILEATLDQLPAAVLLLGPDEKLQKLNAVAREWFAGLNVRVGQKLHTAPDWVSKDRDGVIITPETCSIQRALQDGSTPSAVEMTVAPLAAPDLQFELSLHTSQIKAPDGKTLGAIAVFQDIQRLKAHEKTIRTANEKLLSVIDAAQLHIWSYHLTSDRLVTVEPVATWFQFDTEESIQSFAAFARHIYQDDLPPLQEMLVKMESMEAGKFEVEYRVHQRGGRTAYMLTRGYRVPSGDLPGDPYFSGITIDITQQKAHEQRLRLLESAVVHARDALIILEAEAKGSPGRKVLYANDAFLQITGYDRAEIVGHTLHMLRGPESSVETLEQIREALTNNLPLQVELLNYRKDRSTFWVELSLVPVPDKSGVCSFWVMIQRDITERKRAEQILREREDQLRQSQKMETVGQLAGGVAHDFNNLLTAIIGNLCLVDLPPEDRNRKLLAVAERAAHRAADLTSKLLGFARRNQLLLKPIVVQDFVEEVIELLRRTIDPRIEIRAEMADDPLLVSADETLLNQTLLNLCLNARDAMPLGGELVIRAQAVDLTPEALLAHPIAKNNRYLKLSIEDTGTGIIPENLPRLYEPFFTTKPIGQGTGLGLAMVDGIVRQHSGWIECESAVGHGTSFHIYLPSSDTESTMLRAGIQRSRTEIMSQEPTPLPATIQDTERRSQPGRILLVDDEDMIRTLARAVLESEGHTVIEASDGLEALERFYENRGTLDLVILDLMMPRMSGRDACREMTQCDPNAKILLSSGYSNDDISDLEGAIGLLSKPYRPNELRQAVHDAMNCTQET
ncbi:MAG: PAS domain S-box protein [Fimbriiglobus sp.]